MRVRIGAGLALLALATVFSAPADAAKMCAWMTEKDEPQDRLLTIYLSSDTEVHFFFKVGGKGIVDKEGDGANAPNDGTFVLQAGQTDSPWQFGTTLYPPGAIDVSIEIHQKPEDIFSDKPTPLWTTFTFRRSIPANEKKAPTILSKKQCAIVPGH